MNNMQSNNMVNEKFHHSSHSLKRASRRGIRNAHLDIVIRFGRVEHRQGMKFYFMTDKEMRFCSPVMCDRVKNLVVVTSLDDDTLITCFKERNAIGHIKRKSKKLL